MTKQGNSTFSQFFKEDAGLLKDVLHPNNNVELEEKSAKAKDLTPTLIQEDQASVLEFSNEWKSIRSFFYNADNASGLPDGHFPVHLASLRNQKILASDFPLWVSNNQKRDGEYCITLKELLKRGLESVVSEGLNKSILLKNVDGIIQVAQSYCEKVDGAEFGNAIYPILEEVSAKLEVHGSDKEAFSKEVDLLIAALPSEGYLYNYSNELPYKLLDIATHLVVNPNQQKLKKDIKVLVSKLKDLLKVEQDKSESTAKTVDESLSFADSIVQFEKLSSLKSGSGSIPMEDSRINRIQESLRYLEDCDSLFEEEIFLFIDEVSFKHKQLNWSKIVHNSDIVICENLETINKLKSAFEQHMQEYSKVFIAKRIAELELENDYQSDVFDAYFDNFDWQNFDDLEMNACPKFVGAISDKQLINQEFNELSEVLSENLPIKLLVLKSEEDEVEEDLRDLHAHAELGSLLFSFKNIFVHQAITIAPQNLFNGLFEGLDVFAPSCFYIQNEDFSTKHNPLLELSATLESRDFPCFTYKGLLGTPWGSRFNVSKNPAADIDWPIHKTRVLNNGAAVDMNFSFSFADLASIHAQYHHHFLNVPSRYWSDNLIYLPEYLSNNQEDNVGKIPFIWMVNQENVLCKVAVSFTLVRATQERLDFWRLLQENSGINNYHVKRAIEEVSKELNENFALELADLKTEHQREIAKVKEEEAEKVMENLTNVLLDLDVSNLSVSSTQTPLNKTVKKEEVKVEERATDEIVEEAKTEEVELEAYIDTPLCTTCNECTGINKDVFKYNDDKLAYIKDASAGSYSEIVEAAELCPVGIIHPGTPLNKNEEGLEELMKRAAKFNM